jgi:hypothetical protein
MHRLSLHICLVADDANVTSPKRGPEAPHADQRLTLDGIDSIEAKPAKAALEAGSMLSPAKPRLSASHGLPHCTRRQSSSGCHLIPESIRQSLSPGSWLMTSARYARRYSRGTNGALWICVGRGRSKPSLAVPKALP